MAKGAIGGVLSCEDLIVRIYIYVFVVLDCVVGHCVCFVSKRSSGVWAGGLGFGRGAVGRGPAGWWFAVARFGGWWWLAAWGVCFFVLLVLLEAGCSSLLQILLNRVTLFAALTWPVCKGEP